mmetsp:Transcript_20561/g.56761  ORF Transcript_20561/g.56761 Transcript_20561/m.56761 type:complete len:235 (+) Transcript_20561:217-921(+)
MSTWPLFTRPIVLSINIFATMPKSISASKTAVKCITETGLNKSNTTVIAQCASRTLPKPVLDAVPCRIVPKTASSLTGNRATKKLANPTQSPTASSSTWKSFVSYPKIVWQDTNSSSSKQPRDLSRYSRFVTRRWNRPMTCLISQGLEPINSTSIGTTMETKTTPCAGPCDKSLVGRRETLVWNLSADIGRPNRASCILACAMMPFKWKPIYHRVTTDEHSSLPCHLANTFEGI